MHATPLAFGQGFHILSFPEGKSPSLRTEVSGKVQVNHPLGSIDSWCRRPAAGTVEVLPLRLFLPDEIIVHHTVLASCQLGESFS